MCRARGGGAKGERGERFIILPLCTPGGNFNATRIAFRLQHISLSLLSSFTDSFSLYPLLPLSVSFLYSPRAAVDHALTAIKVSICIAPIQHCKALLPTVLFCYIQCYILYAWQTFPLPDWAAVSDWIWSLLFSKSCIYLSFWYYLFKFISYFFCFNFSLYFLYSHILYKWVSTFSVLQISNYLPN